MIQSKISQRGSPTGASNSVFYLQHTHADIRTHAQNDSTDQLLMEHSLTPWVRINPGIAAAAFGVSLVAGRYLFFLLHRKSLEIHILLFLFLSVPAKVLHEGLALFQKLEAQCFVCSF